MDEQELAAKKFWEDVERSLVFRVPYEDKVEFDRKMEEKVSEYEPLNLNNMDAYIGTKIVLAEPMSFNEFQDVEGFEKRAEEDMEGYRVKYEDGYVSWSPKRVFEHAYRLMTGSEAKYAGMNLPEGLDVWETGDEPDIEEDRDTTESERDIANVDL